MEFNVTEVRNNHGTYLTNDISNLYQAFLFARTNAKKKVRESAAYKAASEGEKRRMLMLGLGLIGIPLYSLSTWLLRTVEAKSTNRKQNGLLLWDV